MYRVGDVSCGVVLAFAQVEQNRVLTIDELRRAQRETEIKKSVETLSTGMLMDLERRIAARTAELEAEVAERERNAHEAAIQLENWMKRTKGRQTTNGD